MSVGIFELEITRDGAGGYCSRVLASPAGEASAPFVPPFGPEELADLRRAWEQDAQRGAARAARNLAAEAEEGEATDLTPEIVGRRLFEAAFTGKVRSCLDESRGKAAGALRLMLRIDLERNDAAWISDLPWELLYDPDRSKFMALDPSTPIIRWLEVQGMARQVSFRPPLRILLLAASPTDRLPLEIEEEARRLEGEIRRRPGIEVRRLVPATVAEVQRVLYREERFHVVHFMGHGELDPWTGFGCLVFQTSGREADLLSAELLGDLFCGREPSLFVLNACETARSRFVPGANPFAGVAAKLVQQGAPAVVAMQLPIADQAAILFSEAFYGALVNGMSMDAAVAEGRLAIRCARRNSAEWATPVLFLRTRDGRLFEAPQPAPIGQVEPQRQPEQSDPPAKRGGMRVTIGTVNGPTTVAEQVNNTCYSK